MLTRWTIGVLLASFLTVGVWVNRHLYKDRSNYRCEECFSGLVREQWRAGEWMGTSIPLLPGDDKTRVSHLYQDMFSGEHRHRWTFSQGSPLYGRGEAWGGCALGENTSSTLERYYDDDPDFRDHVRRSMAAGQITRNDFLRAVQSTRGDGGWKSPGMRLWFAYLRSKPD